MGRKLLLKDEAGLLQFRAAIADGDAKRARAVMKEFGPSSLTADQISGAVRYQMRLQKKREAEAKAEAIAIAAASNPRYTVTTKSRSKRLAPRPSLRDLRGALRDALKAPTDLTLRRVVPNRRGIHSVLGSAVPHTAERLLCAAACTKQLHVIDDAGQHRIKLERPLSMNSHPQRQRLLTKLEHATSAVTVINNCVAEEILTMDQIKALHSGYKSTFMETNAAPDLEAKLLQQLARKDNGAPAAKPTRACTASKSKDKQSGVSHGDAVTHLGYVIPQGGTAVSEPVLYAEHRKEEWELFHRVVSIGTAESIWAWMMQQSDLAPACDIMRQLAANAALGGTGFSSSTKTSDLARGTHTDWVRTSRR